MKINLENLSSMPKEEVQEHLHLLRSQITCLEWDKQRDQLNPGKKVYLEKIKQEYEELKKKFEEIFDRK